MFTDVTYAESAFLGGYSLGTGTGCGEYGYPISNGSGLGVSIHLLQDSIILEPIQTLLLTLE